MLVMSCSNISKNFGIENIFNNINFNINAGEKVGLVGLNGSGKTTLLDILSGQLDADEGDIYIRKELEVGYLKQHVQINSEKTIYEECLEVFNYLKEMEVELRSLEMEIEKLAKNNSSKLEEKMDLYGKKIEKFEELNGYGYESQIRGVLTGLGFEEEDFNQKINTLSGGQKSRVSLAKLLLESPDILLLDEPTNHLDITAIEWLTSFIKDFAGTVLLISHDRYFLDEVVERIFHLENNHLEIYNTNYTQFIRRRKENLEVRKKHYENQQAEIERQKEIIERYKRYGGERYNRLAKSRQKLLDKMEIIDPVEEEGNIHFSLKPKVESGMDVLSVENLGKSFDDKKIFENISFDIYKGDKVGLIGPNGVGKSTLFKILLGHIKNYEGEYKIGHQVNIGYFDQEMSDLDLEKNIIDEIWDDNPDLTHTEIRTLLSQFMFLGEDVFKEISDLSGGEKSRVSILKLMLSESNFLLLDEPTNHLDIDSKEVLEDALIDYEGTILVISHDRYFLNKVVDKILDMKNNKITEYLGNYNYYHEKINEVIEVTENTGKTQTQIQAEKKKKRELERIKREKKKKIKKLEEIIDSLEKEIEDIDYKLADNKIYDDRDKVLSLTEKRTKIEENLNKNYDLWISLQE